MSTPPGAEQIADALGRVSVGDLGARVPVDANRLDDPLSLIAYMVNGVLASLQARQREAERAMGSAAASEAKDHFLANMSHELLTPLNAIMGTTTLLLESGLTPEQRSWVEAQRASGAHLLELVRDILDLSRLETSRLELELHPFSPRAVLQDACDLIASDTAARGLELSVSVGPEVPEALVGDVARLRQVLANLLSNAVKFTDAGEVSCSLASRPVDDSFVELAFSVTDTGIGIPTDRAQELFVPFWQLDASPTRLHGGAGLGLAICKRLVEMLGGGISVRSEEGKGSTFAFTVRAEPISVVLPHRGPVSPVFERRRVLVVDDNATSLMAVERILAAWGAATVAFASPGEALAWVCDGEGFDVAVLDYLMPDMDGAALAEEIEGATSGKAPPLVLLSGSHPPPEVLGRFAAVLLKPVRPDELRNALSTAMGLGDEASEAEPSDLGLQRREPLAILVAEDNPVNQKVLIGFLARLGYTADLARHGGEACEAVERKAYDVVLMDLHMPEMDGLEATRRIVARFPFEERPRIIAFTAYASEEGRRDCLAAGMDDYLTKPVTLEKLVAVLERCQPGAAQGTPSEGGELFRRTV